MRELTLDELELVAGGTVTDGYDGGGDIVVTAPSGDGGDWGDFGDFGDYGDYGDGGGGDSGGDSPPPPPEPPCNVVNPATIESATGEKYTGLDGAKYYVPQNIDNNYINAAAAHLTEVRNTGYPGQIYAELYAMYTDTSHPNFLDFKESGTASMPGTPDAGTQTYYSEAAGQTITTSQYEPYGNVLYGFMMTVAGYSPEETWAVAAAMQEGHGSIGIPQDDPQDTPHVNLGISVAQQYLATGQTYSPLNIDSTAC